MSKFAAAKSQALPLTPEVPFDPSVVTYTRFGSAFEAYEFTDWIDESLSWKETCYIGDWSPLAKIKVKGPDALRFFSDISINSFAKFVIGQAKHAVFCNAAGKVMGEGVLMKLDEDEYLFTSGPGVPWAVFQFAKGNYDAVLSDVKELQTIVQVQGPNALFVLEKATGESLRDIGFMRFRESGIGEKRFLLLRQGMSGSLTWAVIAVARWVLPVPVPPTRTMLRRPSRNDPLCSDRTSPSLIGVPSKAKVAISFTAGSLAAAIR